MAIELYDSYQIAGHYLPAIFNNDESGMTPIDIDNLNAFYRRLPAVPCTFDVVTEEASFDLDEISGYMADCYQVDVYITAR